MGFLRSSKLKSVWILVVVVGIALVGQGAFAQEADTSAQAADTATVTVADASATDTAEAGTETAAAAGGTASESVAPAAEVADEGTTIDPQVYKNFFYGVLVVFLICVLVGVIGKILQIYELTRRMNGKDTTYYQYNFNAVMFLIALVLGLYGVYWSYVHHGGQSFRAAVTEHGAKIDTMFIITTIICTIVLVV